MGNKYRKIFAIERSKGCKFMPKMNQKLSLAVGLCPDPLGELIRPSCRNGGGLTSEAREEREPTSKGVKGRGGAYL